MLVGGDGILQPCLLHRWQHFPQALHLTPSLNVSAWIFLVECRPCTNPVLPWYLATFLPLIQPCGGVPDEPESTSVSSPNLLQSRLGEALRADVAVTADLRLLVRGSMDALRATLGDQGWQAAVETVEPVVLGELQRMVA